MSSSEFSTKATEVLLYVPNVINYVRVCVALLMLYQMRTRPFVSFALCLVSGLLDTVDGPVARRLHQTSRFGYLLDLGMDRLTNAAQMFVLGTCLPSYALCFFHVALVELLKDLAECVLSAYRLRTQLVYQLFDMKSGSSSSFEHVRQSVLNEMGIFRTADKNHFTNNNSTTTIETATHSSFNIFSSIYFYYYVWYSSDLFYCCLLYTSRRG